MARAKKVEEEELVEMEEPENELPKRKAEKTVLPLPIIGRQPETEQEEEYLREELEYEFYNMEEPGTSLTFPYGSTKSKKNFLFVHGKKYKIPRHIARHIESCSVPLYKWQADGSGAMKKTRIGTKSRFQMRPVFV